MEAEAGGGPVSQDEFKASLKILVKPYFKNWKSNLLGAEDLEFCRWLKPYAYYAALTKRK